MGLTRAAPFLRAVDTLTEAAGRLAGVLAIVLVALSFGLVLARHALGVGSVAAQEAVLWLHSALFLLGLAFALKHASHVRVDVFSQRWTPRTRARIELAGMVLLLLPFCVFIVAMSWDYVGASWSAREGSRDPGGLPGWYLLKSLLPLSAALLMLQALAETLRAARTAFGQAKA
ncbi:MAG: TRAP transporter small permease subunit [Arenimonas sp.]|uniref:TRAP transporter small permease subunit n=1 Tax=Arenimonas sp. TaxID=1872635 RepID=UPI0025BBA9A8|nr:TRAP transporter small permease subunit [Arenimonas sp.]MBW8367445.1 TRAP transporter small permease subunit [Arenimonas sp.]